MNTESSTTVPGVPVNDAESDRYSSSPAHVSAIASSVTSTPVSLPPLGNHTGNVIGNDSVSVNTTLSSSTTKGVTVASKTSASTNTSAGTSAASKPAQTETTPQFITKPRLQELVRELDPSLVVDDEVEDLLMEMADHFVDNVVNAACLLAKHRKVNKVEVRDVQLHLERNLDMWIPGFGTDEVKPYKRSTVTDAHKQRLALIRKAAKKY